jgi:hypothetical protein
MMGAVHRQQPRNYTRIVVRLMQTVDMLRILTGGVRSTTGKAYLKDQ